MKIIIDIPEEDYRECKFRKDLLSLGEEPTDLTFNMRMETLIANGTPFSEENNTQKLSGKENLCESCTNMSCEFQSGIKRSSCAFYMPPRLESDNCGNYIY